MSHDDPYAYRGDVDPSDLKQPVTFRGSWFSGIVGLGLGLTSFFVLALIILGFWLIVDPLHPLSQESVFLPTVLVGLVCGILVFRSSYGVALTVSDYGIVVTRQNKTLQDCPWGAMTVKVSRRLLGTSSQLCDQLGQPFQSALLISSHPDQRLASLAMQTWARRLAAHDPAPTQTKKTWWKFTWPLAVVGIMGVVTGPYAARNLVAVVGNADATPGQRATALLLAILSGLAACAVFALYVALAASLETWLKRRLGDKRPKLTEFIQARKGRLTPVEMAPDTWYAYVDPDGLKERESYSAAGIVLLIFGLFVAIVPTVATSSSTVPDDKYVWMFALPLGLLLAILGAYTWRLGIRLRRGLRAEYRLAGGEFLVRKSNGDTKPYTKGKVRMQKESRTTFGWVSWELRGTPIILLDPRYLVPISDGPALPT